MRGSVTELSGNEGDVVKSALQLLQSLPATRSAVLQCITDIYDSAVSHHLEQRKRDFSVLTTSIFTHRPVLLFLLLRLIVLMMLSF